MTLVLEDGDYAFYKYVPTLFRAFHHRMEPVSVLWRIRCVLEYFVGYAVYYLKYQDEYVGYCVVSNGRNPRYDFSGKEDIIFGRYFIAEPWRGKGLAFYMLDRILNRIETGYRYAFDYIRNDNIASTKTTLRLGATLLKRVRIDPFTKRLVESPDGAYSVYVYQKNRSGDAL